MENRKLEKVLSLLLGVSWSILMFGTILIFLTLIISSSFATSIVATFIFFLFSATLVIFLESLRIQLKQSDEIQDILNFIKSEKDAKSKNLEKVINEK